MEEGTSVIITVGVRQQVEAPDLVGLEQAEASARLADLGLSSETTARDTGEEAQAWLVLSRDPAPGVSIDKGSRVSLVVGDHVPVYTASGGSSGRRTGTENSASCVTCPSCDGRGTISIPSPPRRVTCPYCGGIGNLDFPYCGGLSSIAVWDGEPGAITRTTCGGSGRIS